MPDPALVDGPVTVYRGDALDVLRSLPAESVHCVVTSPPYWQLRDYGTATWEGGDPACKHRQSELRRGVNLAQSAASTRGGAKKIAEAGWIPYRDVCGKCGARRIDAQLGLERTPEEYVEHMVAVFREVRRVLRPDGTCWLNIGDSYNAYNGNRGASRSHSAAADGARPLSERGLTTPTLKPKDLVGMPWRLAFALQADGWWIRSDIVWAKPNPMPESVTDRPTSAHEHVFLLTRSARYFYDGEPVREPNVSPEQAEHNARYAKSYPAYDDVTAVLHKQPGAVNHKGIHARGGATVGRNMRNVWEIATEPYPAAHFATFPSELPLRAIKAGTSEHGVCAECGAPWRRVVEITPEYAEFKVRARERLGPHYHMKRAGLDAVKGKGSGRNERTVPTQNSTTGWRPTCAHQRSPVPATVLDPFAGSGTTLAVARRLGRRGIGIELNPDYLPLIARHVGAHALPLLEMITEEPELWPR